MNTALFIAWALIAAGVVLYLARKGSTTKSTTCGSLVTSLLKKLRVIWQDSNLRRFCPIC